MSTDDMIRQWAMVRLTTICQVVARLSEKLESCSKSNIYASPILAIVWRLGLLMPRLSATSAARKIPTRMT